MPIFPRLDVRLLTDPYLIDPDLIDSGTFDSSGVFTSISALSSSSEIETRLDCGDELALLKK